MRGRKCGSSVLPAAAKPGCQRRHLIISRHPMIQAKSRGKIKPAFWLVTEMLFVGTQRDVRSCLTYRQTQFAGHFSSDRRNPWPLNCGSDLGTKTDDGDGEPPSRNRQYEIRSTSS